ncbi:MAG: hypothetical protein ACTSO7_11380 [Candidatus Heimdallarchaeota archaeon]
MRMSRNTLRVTLLLLIVSFIPTQITQSLAVGDTLYTYPEDVPVIDGSLEETIWNSSTKLDIKLYDYGNQNNILYLSMMAVYNVDNGSITFAVIIPDETIDSHDMFMILFKTNTTAPLAFYDGIWQFGKNHDLKIMNLVFNSTTDGLTCGGGTGILFDSMLEGTNDVQGISTHSGSQYTFEMTIPLASGDTIGKDISLVKNDEIDFFVFYEDDMDIYSQIRETDGASDFCTLKVGKKGLLGPSPFFIIASLVSMLVVFSYLARKRKRSINK